MEVQESQQRLPLVTGNGRFGAAAPIRFDTHAIERCPGALRNARTGTARDVVLRAFQLAATPITVEQFGATAGTLTADRPAVPVTWFDAIKWCNAASSAEGLSPIYTIADDWVFWNPAADGYRLPTEAEWEFACRAGTAGPTYGPLSQIAWTETDRVESAQSVATKRPNDFDLYDMIGNVWEWCWDLADPARYGRYRSLRGGGWADPTWSCRASVRRGGSRSRRWRNSRVNNCSN